MCSESLPKEFEKTTEVLPFTKYGVSSFQEFKKTEEKVEHLEWLKRAGLTPDEVKLYEDNQSGVLDKHQKVESSVLKSQLETIIKKIDNFHNKPESSKNEDQPTTSSSPDNQIFDQIQPKTNPITFYPEGHPMNELKKIEESLFGHLKNDVIPITKRRKILRRFERKKERILAQGKQLIGSFSDIEKVSQPGSLWDVKEKSNISRPQNAKVKRSIGPKKQTMYTIKDNKVVRLEPVVREEGSSPRVQDQEFRAVDIIMPVNAAEEQLLEGTKMSLDDIKKIERFKDYEPGIPSKVLYLKNIAPTVTQEQVALLFNQFLLDNGGPIDVRLMTGRMRGQAFATFQNDNLAIQALEEINGTVLSGRPIIAQFGRNSNRIQIDER